MRTAPLTHDEPGKPSFTWTVPAVSQAVIGCGLILCALAFVNEPHTVFGALARSENAPVLSAETLSMLAQPAMFAKSLLVSAGTLLLLSSIVSVVFGYFFGKRVSTDVDTTTQVPFNPFGQNTDTALDRNSADLKQAMKLIAGQIDAIDEKLQKQERPPLQPEALDPVLTPLARYVRAAADEVNQQINFIRTTVKSSQDEWSSHTPGKLIAMHEELSSSVRGHLEDFKNLKSGLEDLTLSGKSLTRVIDTLQSPALRIDQSPVSSVSPQVIAAAVEGRLEQKFVNQAASVQSLSEKLLSTEQFQHDLNRVSDRLAQLQPANEALANRLAGKIDGQSDAISTLSDTVLTVDRFRHEMLHVESVLERVEPAAQALSDTLNEKLETHSSGIEALTKTVVTGEQFESGMTDIVARLSAASAASAATIDSIGLLLDAKLPPMEQDTQAAESSALTRAEFQTGLESLTGQLGKLTEELEQTLLETTETVFAGADGPAETRHLSDKLDNLHQTVATIAATLSELPSAMVSSLDQGTDRMLEAIDGNRSSIDRVETRIQELSGVIAETGRPQEIDLTGIVSDIAALRDHVADMSKPSADPRTQSQLDTLVALASDMSEQLGDLGEAISAVHADPAQVEAIDDFSAAARRGENLLAELKELLGDLGNTPEGYRAILESVGAVPAAGETVDRLAGLVDRFDTALSEFQTGSLRIEQSVIPVADGDGVAAEPDTAASVAGNQEAGICELANTVFPDSKLDLQTAINPGAQVPATRVIDSTTMDIISPQPASNGNDAAMSQNNLYPIADGMMRLVGGFHALLAEMAGESAKLRETVAAARTDSQPSENSVPAWFEERMSDLEARVERAAHSMEAAMSASADTTTVRISEGVAFSLADFERILTTKLEQFGENLVEGTELIKSLRADIPLRSQDSGAGQEIHGAGAEFAGRTGLRMATQLMHAFALSVEERFDATEEQIGSLMDAVLANEAMTPEDYETLLASLVESTTTMRSQVQEFLGIAAAVSHDLSASGAANLANAAG